MTLALDPPALLEFTRLRDMTGLAEALGVSVDYIRAMRRHGFSMPGGRASIALAQSWLAEHAPEFHVNPRSGKPVPAR